jgi:CTP-dependent riboflavin kinase
MIDYLRVKGIIKKGYGVASGKGGDKRFPNGTIEMQKPFFRELGLDLQPYFPGTLNISISPHQYSVKQAKYTFKNLKWAENEPAEDFSFFDCRIQLKNGELQEGLIYYPHPDTKPEHFQAADILEIITFKIDDLKYDDEVILEVDSQQIEII